MIQCIQKVNAIFEIQNLFLFETAKCTLYQYIFCCPSLKYWQKSVYGRGPFAFGIVSNYPARVVGISESYGSFFYLSFCVLILMVIKTTTIQNSKVDNMKKTKATKTSMFEFQQCNRACFLNVLWKLLQNLGCLLNILLWIRWSWKSCVTLLTFLTCYQPPTDAKESSHVSQFQMFCRPKSRSFFVVKST